MFVGIHQIIAKLMVSSVTRFVAKYILCIGKDLENPWFRQAEIMYYICMPIITQYTSV